MTIILKSKARLYGVVCVLFALAVGQHSALAQSSTQLPNGVARVQTVEGITEYRLANGL